MREYERKYPLEVLDNYLYPNLRRDGDGRVVSENITCFTLGEIPLDSVIEGKILDRALNEMESKVKEYCSNAELAYQDSSGNRWVFLLSNRNPSKDDLKQMQRAYAEMYDFSQLPIMIFKGISRENSAYP